jgi:type II secretory pathway predicted ATPase ExeA
MFRQTYGFSFNPFDKSLPAKHAFLSRDHKEVVSRLAFLMEAHGLGLITAEPGMGKSFALRHFAESLDPGLSLSSYMCMSTISAPDFYRQFCTALKIDAPYSKSRMFEAIQARAFFLLKEKRTPFFLFIDEAHELSPGILKDLRILMNFSFDSLSCFSLVLSGEPHLNHMLERPAYDALRQRIVAHYNMSGLSQQEVSDYLTHKFRIANASLSILGEGVVPAVAGYSRGNPRIIDRILFDALTIGAQNNATVVSTDIVLSAVNNLSLS